MKPFMNEDFLLTNSAARRLYHEYAAPLPIIDYHCHIDPEDIAEDRRFTDLADAWLSGDHYKWRLMRVCGVDERYITGDAAGWDKFYAFAAILPGAAGNPVYHWAHLELRRYFGCDVPLCADTAREIWTHCNARMPTAREVISRSNVELIITTDEPDSGLSSHRKIRENKGFATRVLPGFRADGAPDYDVAERVAFFAENDCVSADIGTEDFDVVRALAGAVKARGWVMQLRLGAVRDVNSVMWARAGRNAGFDTMGGGADIYALARLLDDLQKTGKLPVTLLFSLNPNDNAAITALAGCFPGVYQGPAWWFNDSADGIAAQLKNLANLGVLGTFPGMLTDSRCVFSYARHEYFRRVFCDILGGFVERGEYPNDSDALRRLVCDVCHDNAARLYEHE